MINQILQESYVEIDQEHNETLSGGDQTKEGTTKNLIVGRTSV